MTATHALRRLSPALVAAALLVAPGPVRAADTWEPYDLGWASVELYVGVDGLVGGGSDATPWASLVLAYGATDWLTVLVEANVEVDGAFADPWGDVALGFVAGALDTDHVDVAGLLWVRGGGPGLAETSLEPGLELHLDLAPDLALAGLYLRASLALFARDAGGGAAETAAELSWAPGLYVTVAAGHQLLAEAELLTDGAGTALDAARLSYNVEVCDALELQLEVSVAPGDDETPVGFGVSLGALFALETPLAPAEDEDE